MRLRFYLVRGLVGAAVFSIGCSKSVKNVAPASSGASTPAPVFQVDPSTAGTITGVIHYQGPRPVHKLIDMSDDPACVAAHKGKAYDESLMVGRGGTLNNAFVYIKSGLEGKHFAVPTTPVVIEQKGCWFHPRVLGIQTNQTFQVVNSDELTHNIHPMAEVNREWNHSQGPGDPPMNRRFVKAEVMIPVKCNIHSWMHAYIGVLDHPYFAVSKEDGSFEIANLPPGTYTLAVWHEGLGTKEQQVTLQPGQHAVLDFTFSNREK